MSKQGHISVGHPVDVACGDFTTKKLDVNIAGYFPILFIRNYNTAYLKRQASIFGPGWHSCFDVSLKIDVDGYTFISSDGAETIFDDPEFTVESGGIARNLDDFAEIRGIGQNLVVTTWGPDEPLIQKYVFLRTGGPVQQILDSTGQGLEFTYQDSRISIIRQIREGREIRLHYNPKGLLQKITVNVDRYERLAVTYDYDPEGRLVIVYDSLGSPERYEYDEKNRMVSEIRRDGAVYHLVYDSGGRCIKTSANDNFDLKTFDYKIKERTTTVTNSLGGLQTYEYNEVGQVTRQTSNLDYTISSAIYDSYGRISSQIDGIGGTWKTEYDDQGNESVITDPAGDVTRIEYNENHIPIKIICNDQSWIFLYDNSNRIIQTTNPAGFQWKYSYNENGDLILIQNPLSEELRYQYDQRGNSIGRSYWDGSVNEYSYDEEGRIILATDSLGNRWTATYDANGQLKSFAFPDGNESKFKWDPAGNIIEVTDRAGQITHKNYLFGGRLQKTTKPNGDTIQNFWGTEPDQLLQIINEKGEVYKFEFDTDCRLIKEIGFDQRVHQYEYDPAGNLSAFINGFGRKVTYTYDPASRILETTLSDGSTISYEHGFWGLSKATSDGCKLEFEYDETGRLIKEKLNDHFVEKSYNTLFLCNQLSTDLGDVIQYEHSKDGFLSGILLNKNQILKIEYNSIGYEIRRILSSTVDIIQEFNSVDLLIRQIVRNQNQPQTTRAYEYNLSGDLTRITDNQWGESRFIYDPLQRITSSLKERGASEVFRYDPTSNITAIGTSTLGNIQDWYRAEQQMLTLPLTECRISAGDRFNEYGNIRYEYDAEGCLVKKSETLTDGTIAEWLYEWDDRSQLIGITRPDGKKWSYFYDPLGRRYKKVGLDGITEYIWNGNSVLYELDNKGNKFLWLYEQERFNPIGVSKDGKFYHCVNDPIGRPVELLDENGKQVWSANFKLWGLTDEISVNDVKCPVRFQGQWFDEESGLHYNRFRYYDPQTGRFISPDPIRTQGSLNLYWYVNSPISDIDPFGLDRPDASMTPDFEGGHHTLPGAMFDSDPGEGVTQRSLAAYNQEGWHPSSGYRKSHAAIHKELARQLHNNYKPPLQTNEHPYPNRDMLAPMRKLSVNKRIQVLKEVYKSRAFLQNVFGGDIKARDQFVKLFELEAERVKEALKQAKCH